MTEAPEPALRRFEVDATDLALLEEVKRDGRATYEALSRALGLSRPATRARLHRLLDAGVLRIVGVVHPSIFGLTAYAHATVTVDGPVLPVADQVCAMDDSVYVSAVAGNVSLAVELRSADHDALAAAVRHLAAIPGAREVTTAVYTAILRHVYFPPQPYQPTAVDDVDRALLKELQHDGRAGFAGLGSAVGLSASAARSRVVRLLECGALHIGARIQAGALGMARLCGFQLTLDGRAAQALAAVSGMTEVEYLASSIGRCDAIGTAVSHSAEGLLQFLEKVRATPGVRSVESWTHLRILKESYDRMLVDIRDG